MTVGICLWTGAAFSETGQPKSDLRAHPNVALLVGGQDHWRRLRVDGRDDSIRVVQRVNGERPHGCGAAEKDEANEVASSYAFPSG